jgi:hypothetical protein
MCRATTKSGAADGSRNQKGHPAGCPFWLYKPFWLFHCDTLGEVARLVNTDLAYQKGVLEQRICAVAKLGNNVSYPLVALIDKDGSILYHSTGYKIGVVEQVLKAAK